MYTRTRWFSTTTTGYKFRIQPEHAPLLISLATCDQNPVKQKPNAGLGAMHVCANVPASTTQHRRYVHGQRPRGEWFFFSLLGCSTVLGCMCPHRAHRPPRIGHPALAAR